MGNINDKLEYLNETKADIRNALIELNQQVPPTTPFRDYADIMRGLEILNGQTKTVTPTTSQQVITPDTNYNALTQVTVNAIQTESKTVKSTTTSQTVTPTAGKFINEITVNPIELESKVVTPTTSQQVITPSQNKDGISSVTVNAVPDETEVLNEQDELLDTQEIKISDLEETLNNKIALDLTNATADANAQAKDIMQGKTAYVNGQKIEGTNDNPDWTEIGYTETPKYIIDGFTYAKDIYDNWDSSITSMQNKYNGDLQLEMFPLVDTSNVTNFYQAFQDSELEYIPVIDTSKVTNFTRAFQSTAIVEVPQLDTKNVTTFMEAFQNCVELEHVANLNTSKAWNTHSMFNSCHKLVTAPTLDTGNVTDAGYMFRNCWRLKNVPIYDFSKNTTFYVMFENCPLTDESLNNVMASFISATSYTGVKTLKNAGINSTRATRCQSLSNWDAFVEAGWTTGY